MSGSGQNTALVVLCTCPDEATARSLAGGLVEARLAACVNIVPTIHSVFRWQGEIQEEREVLMVIKTTVPRLEELQAWLADNHPYDVPEVLALPIESGSAAYLDWIVGETS